MVKLEHGQFVMSGVLWLSPWAHFHVVGTLPLMSWHKPAKLAHSFLFCSCVCFCLYNPSNGISFHKFSRQLSTFSLCSSGLISALLVLSTVYLFMKVSLSPECKVACMCFHAINGSGPTYLSELLHIYTPSRTLRSSSDSRMLKIQQYKRKTRLSHFHLLWTLCLEFTPTRHQAMLNSYIF